MQEERYIPGNPGKKEARRKGGPAVSAPEVKLAQNPLLVEVADKVAQVAPNWEEIVRRFKANPKFLRNSRNWTFVLSKFSEIHLAIAMEEIARLYPERIQLHPIPDKAETGRYRFLNDKNGLQVLDLTKPSAGFPGRFDAFAELDSLVLIDNLPVVTEIKLGKRTGRKNYALPPLETISALKPDTIRRKIEPVREYFKTKGISDCAYMLLIPNELVRANSKTQSQAVAAGTLIRPFYPLNAFVEEAFQAKMRLM